MGITRFYKELSKTRGHEGEQMFLSHDSLGDIVGADAFVVYVADTMREVRSYDPSTCSECVSLSGLRHALDAFHPDIGARVVIHVVDTGEVDENKAKAREARDEAEDGKLAGVLTRDGEAYRVDAVAITPTEARAIAAAFVARIDADGPFACWRSNARVAPNYLDEAPLVYGMSPPEPSTLASTEVGIVANIRDVTYAYADVVLLSAERAVMPPAGCCYIVRGGCGALPRAVGPTRGLCVTTDTELRGTVIGMPHERVRLCATTTHDDTPSTATVAGAELATVTVFLREMGTASWARRDGLLQTDQLCKAIAQRGRKGAFCSLLHAANVALQSYGGTPIAEEEYAACVQRVVREAAERGGIPLTTVTRRLYEWVNVPKQSQADHVVQSLHEAMCRSIPAGVRAGVLALGAPVMVARHADSDWLAQLCIGVAVDTAYPREAARRVGVVCHVWRREAEMGSVFVDVHQAAAAIANRVAGELGTYDHSALARTVAGVARMMVEGTDNLSKIPQAPSGGVFTTFSHTIMEGPSFASVLRPLGIVEQQTLRARRRGLASTLFDADKLGLYMFRPHANNKRVQNKTAHAGQVAYGGAIVAYIDDVMSTKR